MKIEVKDLKDSKIAVRIELSQEQLEKGKKAAMEEIRKEADIPGFRKGKASDAALSKRFGEEYITHYGHSHAMDEAYRDAVIEKQLKIVGSPLNVEIVKEDPYTIEITSYVVPEVKLDDGYKKLKVKEEKVSVSKKEVDDVIADLEKRFTTFEESEEKAEKGDRATISFDGSDPKTKEPIKGTKSPEHPLIIGDGTMIPGFEDEVMGMKKGEKKEFDITFPKEYHNDEFKNRKVHFAIELLKLEKSKKPELNEEFIEKIRGKKMKKDEFLKDVEKQLLEEKQRQDRTRRENEFVDLAVKKYITMGMPQPLIDEEIHHMEHEMEEQVAQYGMKFDDYLTHIKKTKEELRKEWQSDAEQRVKARLMITAIMEKEKVEVTDQDLDNEIDEITKAYEQEEHKKRVKEIYAEQTGEARRKLHSRTQVKKLFDMLLGEGK